MAAVAPTKRVHKEVTSELKYKALLELDNGKTNKKYIRYMSSQK